MALFVSLSYLRWSSKGLSDPGGWGLGKGLSIFLKKNSPTLLWLWSRPAATARIRLLAWKSPYTTGATIEKTDKGKQKQKTKNLFTNHRKWNQLKLRHHYTPTRWPKSQTLTALNVGEEQQELSFVAGGNAKWCSCFARCLGSFLPDEPAIALVGMIQRS